MRFEGTLQSWNDERGFGFLAPDQGGDTIFVHIKSLPRGGGRPQPGQRFSFEVEPGPQGKKRARNVQVVRAARARPPRRRESPARWGTATLFVLLPFLVLCAVVAVLWRPPAWFPLVYVGASLATFVAYAIDKSAARNGSWRTRESSLHLLALAGGWPGALLAQQVLRHKSAKGEFRAVFWGTVVLNVAAFVFLCSPMARGLWPGAK
ncbi:cold shock and DUF1294 domain-containing protein [Ramlibacter sp. USB13]|uniref:Cold shock and DUF1294 domain-containing protein n=1 Tax=Ramlibacter cellulosilyticus TaxID=2764187 RepID=A0A923MSU8_9BURK|nr:cold shock and DUF1294 domain-containing protein [Ramlibacter cellulosilyticus]MBC5783187.1 cold shock and DUF1294 domain-containing protein [Ramlibacter cellulosilyticus]